MESVKTNAAESETHGNEHHQALLSNLVQAQHDLDAQKLQQQPARGKGKATASNAMEIDELDNVSGSGGRAGAEAAARKKAAAMAGVRGSKRSRA